MPEQDQLLTPMELKRLVPKFGIAFQRNHRKSGDFPIPHTKIGNRFFYTRFAVKRFLSGLEAKSTTAQADGAVGALFAEQEAKVGGRG